MGFLVDIKHKIILGWSPKCGCSHIKNIFLCLQQNVSMSSEIHDEHNMQNNLPNDIEEYSVFIVIRNPYKRIISGFLDKYKKGGQFRNKWGEDSLTFSKFVDEIVKENWNKIDKFHFIRQTAGFHGPGFLSEKLTRCKELMVCDLENINYKYLEKKFNKKISPHLISWVGPHKNNNITEGNFKNINNIYDNDIDEYASYHIPYYKFYNKEIQDKVYEYYKDDFYYSYSHGFEYDFSMTISIKDNKIDDKEEEPIHSNNPISEDIINSENINDTHLEYKKVTDQDSVNIKNPTSTIVEKAIQHSPSNTLSFYKNTKYNSNYLYHKNNQIIIIWDLHADSNKILDLFIKNEKLVDNFLKSKQDLKTYINSIKTDNKTQYRKALHNVNSKFIQFTVNPYKRAVSLYLHFITKSMNIDNKLDLTFEEFIEKLSMGDIVLDNISVNQMFYLTNKNIDIYHIEELKDNTKLIKTIYGLSYYSKSEN